MVTAQENHSSDHRYEKTIEIQDGDTRLTKKIEEKAADKRPDNTEQYVAHYTLAGSVDQLASDEACHQPQ